MRNLERSTAIAGEDPGNRVAVERMRVRRREDLGRNGRRKSWDGMVVGGGWRESWRCPE